MKPPNPRRLAVALAAPVLIGWALFAPGSAQAAPAPMLAGDASAATSLSDGLGARSAGSYLDAASGRMVVTVTDAAAAAQVERAGAVAKLVKHSSAKLASVTADLTLSASVPGSSWAVDPVTNQGKGRVTTTNPSTNVTYCLKSPGSTAPGRYVTVVQCPTNTTTETTWTFYGHNTNYSTSYILVDYQGNCMTPTDPAVDKYSSGQNISKIVMAPCTGSTG